MILSHAKSGALALAVLLTFVKAVTEAQLDSQPEPTFIELDFRMPAYPTVREDEYLCTTIELPDRPMKLVGVESLSDQGTVHHMLLFGCKTPSGTDPVWPCRMRAACGEGGENVMYGWGKNAPAVHLPEGVGFSVGPGTSTRAVVLQIHYLKIRPEGDTSGIRLRLTPHPVPLSAGLIAFASGFEIPPRKKSTVIPNECCYSGFETLHGFAFRVHTHSLGRNVALETSHPVEEGKWTPRALQVQQDPQMPQGFYPIDSPVTVRPGDKVNMYCDFNSENMVSFRVFFSYFSQ